MNLAEVAD